MRAPGPLRAFGARVRARRGSKIATVAVARKLVCLTWQLLTTGQDYHYERPALTFRKLRRLEIAAGAPKRCNPHGPDAPATPDTAAQWTTERAQAIRAISSPIVTAPSQVARSRRGLLAHLVRPRPNSNVEIGRQNVGRQFWERCETALRAHGALLNAYSNLQARLAEQHKDRATEHASPIVRDAIRALEPTFARLQQNSGAVSIDAFDASTLEHRLLDACQAQRRPSQDRPLLTLVGGYAGSGKSEFGRFLSSITGWTLLDKDTLTRPLAEGLLVSLGGDPNDRHTALYRERVRPLEYRCLLSTAYENLTRGVSTVLTAPFVAEIADEAWLGRSKVDPLAPVESDPGAGSRRGVCGSEARKELAPMLPDDAQRSDAVRGFRQSGTLRWLAGSRRPAGCSCGASLVESTWYPFGTY